MLFPFPNCTLIIFLRTRSHEGLINFFTCVCTNKKIMTSILPPPEFTVHGPPFYNSGKFPYLDYRDKISTKVWPDKNKFVQAAMRIEQHMEEHRYQPANEQLFTVMYGRCKEPSQFEPHITWGCKTYVDLKTRMKWPGGYVQHYIAKWNVMPTQAFFQYVLYRTAHPFPGFGTTPNYKPQRPQYEPPRPQPYMTATPKYKPYMAATYKNCPPNKIVNPVSGRCVLRTGKIGRQILAGR